MEEYKPFSNPYPRAYRETEKLRETFDRIASRIKERYYENGKIISDDEAIQAARNLTGYMEMLMGIADRQIKEGKITPEEIEAARKKAEEMVLHDDGRHVLRVPL